MVRCRRKLTDGDRQGKVTVKIPCGDERQGQLVVKKIKYIPVVRANKNSKQKNPLEINVGPIPKLHIV